MANLGNGNMRCHNCGEYAPLNNSPDGGVTCSKKCSDEYLAYLNKPINEECI